MFGVVGDSAAGAVCPVLTASLLLLSGPSRLFLRCHLVPCGGPGLRAVLLNTRFPQTTREAGVKERYLETVLPARGGKVIVVRGAEKGATGKLLAKNKEKETALVQVGASMLNSRFACIVFLGHGWLVGKSKLWRCCVGGFTRCFAVFILVRQVVEETLRLRPNPEDCSWIPCSKRVGGGGCVGRGM